MDGAVCTSPRPARQAGAGTGRTQSAVPRGGLMHGALWMVMNPMAWGFVPVGLQAHKQGGKRLTR